MCEGQGSLGDVLILRLGALVQCWHDDAGTVADQVDATSCIW